jgi:hypothetical protein
MNEKDKLLKQWYRRKNKAKRSCVACILGQHLRCHNAACECRQFHSSEQSTQMPLPVGHLSHRPELAGGAAAHSQL